MKSSRSPFKKLSHSREASTGERPSSASHKRTVSGSSATNSHHIRNVSGSGNAPPVSGINTSHRRTTSNSSRSSQNSNFLAEQYERDRKAIIASCFSTHDPRHSEAPNSYITHVRIIEDSRSPSARPPPTSALQNKKKRILIMSVKPNNSSAIQLQKGRENQDGSFQIGRTWDLKELTRVERDTEINEGFILTLGKKYYWETNSAKERTVFIKSLINAFMQAFDGHVPELVNWDLSTFYLDEKSYNRAVITRTPSTSRTTTTTTTTSESTRENGNGDHAAAHSQVKSPERADRLGQDSQVTRGNVVNALNKVPYANSPTIIEANKRYETQLQDRASPVRNDQTPASIVSGDSGTTTQSQRSSRHIPQAAFATPVWQREVSPPGDSVLGKESQSEKHMSMSESRSDHLLEELNEMLSPAGLASSGAIPMETDDSGSKEFVDAEPVVKSAKVQTFPESHQYEPKAFDEKSLDLNETISVNEADEADDTNDLSFERGDEVRYSQALDPDSMHMYHEVSTIQEEALVTNAEESALINLEGTKTPIEKQEIINKKTWDIDDEEVLEILTEINWDIDDDAESLIKRLNAKMAETEYNFNNTLLSLEKLGSTLLPYEQNVDRECDRMNPILSLFLMEMGNVAGDIEYVESQNNGLQVESANKKLLWNTLSELLNTVSLNEANLNELLNYPITEKYLGRMEQQLVALYKALKAINGEKEEGHYNLGEMRALKQRREAYEKVTKVFIERLVTEMTGKFANSSKDDISEDQLSSFLSRLLKFSSLTLFCKEISPESYQLLIESWINSIAGVYNKMCHSILKELKILKDSFPLSEQKTINEQRGLNALLSQWKHPNDNKTAQTSNTESENLLHSLREYMQTIGRWCIFYQNFIDNFFHISSKLDFEQFVKKYSDPNSRMIPLTEYKSMQSDRDSASIETQIVSRTFQPIVNHIASCFTDLLKGDRSIAPALMISLEQEVKVLESTNAEFLMTAVSRVLSQVKQVWVDHVDEQIMYLERLSISVSSKCILPSVIGLPLFIKNSQDLIKVTEREIHIEDDSSFKAAQIYDAACSKMSSAVAKLLARKNDTNKLMDSAEAASSDSANIDRTITLLMNCHWLLELLTLLNGKGVFDSSLQDAKKIFDVEKETYASFLLRVAMPKLTLFVHGASNLIDSTVPGRVADPSKWAAYSKHNLENILIGYTSNEIDILVKRLHDHMLSHFANEPDENMKEVLCDKLWSCIQGQTVSLYLKLYMLIEKHYKGTYVKFTKNDIITAFERYKKQNFL